MRRKPKRGTRPASRMAVRRSRIRPESAQMALILPIFVTPMATSLSGLPGKLPDLIAQATAPHPSPLLDRGEREGPAQREGEGQGAASPDLSEGIRRCRALTVRVVDATLQGRRQAVNLRWHQWCSGLKSSLLEKPIFRAGEAEVFPQGPAFVLPPEEA